MAGMRFQASTLGPCSFFAHVGAQQESRRPILLIFWAVGQDVLALARRYLGRRNGASKSQERIFAHVVAELPQGKDFSGTLAQQKFTAASQFIRTTGGLRAWRQRPLNLEGSRRRQCK